MIYVETGSTDVYYNFGVEYYLASEKKLDDTVFMLWRTTPTLMVGKYQNTLEEINRAYAEEHGIQVVRRMSGGGTIYTDLGGWQFTFIEQGDSGDIQFEQYTHPVLEALRALGVPAAFNGRNDLLIDGRKFSGNAQYKLGGCTVHHGSLLFDTDIAQMVASTTVDEYKIISKSIKSVRERVTNISEHLKAPMDAEAFKRHMVKYIMNGSSAVYELTDADRAAARAIADEKFASWQSKYGMNPRFSLTKKGRFAGGKITFCLDVKKGVIAGASVSGDFFAEARAETLADALTGCAFEYDAILNRLKECGYDGAIHAISAADMAKTITQ